MTAATDHADWEALPQRLGPDLHPGPRPALRQALMTLVTLVTLVLQGCGATAWPAAQAVTAAAVGASSDALPRLLDMPARPQAAAPVDGPEAPRRPGLRPPSDALLAELLRRVGTPACQRDAQCSVLAVGEQACGGAERYLAYSQALLDAAALQALHGLAERQRAARRAENQAMGAVSTCRVLPQPGVQCAVPAAGGAAARCLLIENATTLAR